MTSLRSIRLDAGEYGTVIETEGVLPDGLQLEFNRGLRPIEALKSLESLAMVRGMTTRLSPLLHVGLQASSQRFPSFYSPHRISCSPTTGGRRPPACLS